MPRVFAIGETVCDIIFKNDEPVSARPGGAMLNSAVSLGRLGVEVYLISEFGPDMEPLGKKINQFLIENQVNTLYSNRSEDGKTTVALAFLNDNNDAEYSFYKSSSENRLNFPEIDFCPDDVVLFGSLFSLTKEIRPYLEYTLKKAVNSGTIIVYDPNFRKPHLQELAELKPIIMENLKYPDIIRGSDDDFNLIFNAKNAEEAFQIISRESSANLIYTQNRNGVDLITLGNRMHVPAQNLNPVSTVGAGDNFNAGIIWTLIRDGITKKDIEHLPAKKWGKMLSNGIRFASDVCMSYNNYISIEFAVEILNE